MNTAHVKRVKRLDARMVDTVLQAAPYMTTSDVKTVNMLNNAYDLEVIRITARALKRKQLHEQVRDLSDNALIELMGADRDTLEAMPGDDILRMMDGE